MTSINLIRDIERAYRESGMGLIPRLLYDVRRAVYREVLACLADDPEATAKVQDLEETE